MQRSVLNDIAAAEPQKLPHERALVVQIFLVHLNSGLLHCHWHRPPRGNLSPSPAASPVYGANTPLPGPTLRMGFIFTVGIFRRAARGLRRSGVVGTRASEAILRSCGSSAGRPASRIERRHRVVTRFFLRLALQGPCGWTGGVLLECKYKQSVFPE